MALSLDDRILGEKVDNYCSSDEGEQDEEDKPQKETDPKASSIPETQLKDYNKFSTNVSQFFSDLTISDPQLCPIKITSLGWYQYFVGWGSENLYTVYVSSPCSLLLRWLNSNKIKLFNIVLTKKFIAISKCNKDIDMNA